MKIKPNFAKLLAIKSNFTKLLKNKSRFRLKIRFYCFKIRLNFFQNFLVIRAKYEFLRKIKFKIFEKN